MLSVLGVASQRTVYSEHSSRQLEHLSFVRLYVLTRPFEQQFCTRGFVIHVTDPLSVDPLGSSVIHCWFALCASACRCVNLRILLECSPGSVSRGYRRQPSPFMIEVSAVMFLPLRIFVDVCFWFDRPWSFLVCLRWFERNGFVSIQWSHHVTWCRHGAGPLVQPHCSRALFFAPC